MTNLWLTCERKKTAPATAATEPEKSRTSARVLLDFDFSRSRTSSSHRARASSVKTKLFTKSWSSCTSRSLVVKRSGHFSLEHVPWKLRIFYIFLHVFKLFNFGSAKMVRRISFREFFSRFDPITWFFCQIHADLSTKVRGAQNRIGFSDPNLVMSIFATWISRTALWVSSGQESFWSWRLLASALASKRLSKSSSAVSSHPEQEEKRSNWI